MIFRPCDAMSGERFERPAVGRSKSLVQPPIAKVLLTVGKCEAKNGVEWVVVRTSQHTNREGDSIWQRCRQRGNDGCPEALPDGEHLIEVETIDQIFEIGNMSGNTERRRLPPCCAAPTQVDGDNGDISRQPPHHEVPRASVGQSVMHQEHCAGVLLDGPATPHHHIVSVTADTNS